MEKIGLNVAERINILSILPREGNFIDLGIIRELAQILNLSEDEIKEFEITVDGNNYRWNKKGDEEIVFEIGPRGFSLICELLEKLDKNNKLEMNHFTLFNKFIKQKE